MDREEYLALIRDREPEVIDRIIARLIGKEVVILEQMIQTMQTQELPENDLFEWDLLIKTMDHALYSISEVLNASLQGKDAPDLDL